jgi:hypothetical protein
MASQTTVQDLKDGTRLACQSCQRRKIKCDRDMPCLACRTHSRSCVPIINQRLPRGFAGGRKKNGVDLSKRVEKLEALLQNLQAQSKTLPANLEANVLSISKEGSDTVGHGMSLEPTGTSYLGSVFWDALNEELSNLSLDVDHGDLPKDEEAEFVGDSQTLVGGSDGDSPPQYDPVFGIAPAVIVLQHPLPLVRSHLCTIYFRNIDAVFKVLHAPSVRAHIEDGSQYLGYSDESSAVNALAFVIYYAAVTTMTDAECISTLWQTKQQAVRQFKQMAEAALVQADHIITRELTTLQAFIIYLVST